MHPKNRHRGQVFRFSPLHNITRARAGTLTHTHTHNTYFVQTLDQQVTLKKTKTFAADLQVRCEDAQVARYCPEAQVRTVHPMQQPVHLTPAAARAAGPPRSPDLVPGAVQPSCSSLHRGHGGAPHLQLSPGAPEAHREQRKGG